MTFDGHNAAPHLTCRARRHITSSPNADIFPMFHWQFSYLSTAPFQLHGRGFIFRITMMMRRPVRRRKKHSSMPRGMLPRFHHISCAAATLGQRRAISRRCILDLRYNWRALWCHARGHLITIPNWFATLALRCMPISPRPRIRVILCRAAEEMRLLLIYGHAYARSNAGALRPLPFGTPEQAALHLRGNDAELLASLYTFAYGTQHAWKAWGCKARFARHLREPQKF